MRFRHFGSSPEAQIREEGTAGKNFRAAKAKLREEILVSAAAKRGGKAASAALPRQEKFGMTTGS